MSSAIPRLRVGLVGCRFAAHFHLLCWRKVYGIACEVVGVTSKSSENAKAFAAKEGLSAYESVEALAENVDVLDICAPPFVHVAAALAAAAAGKHAIIEKPYTGCFGPAEGPFDGFNAPKEPMLEAVMASCRRVREAVVKAGVRLAYGENWVYAPPIRKEAEIIEKTGARLLWLRGEESHSGSHSAAYGIWRLGGGGSLVGKAVHPLSAALYLKRVEGIASGRGPIRPKTASARTHQITKLPVFRNLGHLRPDYEDIEDYSMIHVVFDDGTVADIWSGELVMGGVYNWLEVMADNHRTRCSINPTDAVQTYNPREEQLRDVYVVEKIGTKQGWTRPAPDEDWITGYPQEIQDFAESFAFGRDPLSGMDLGEDTMATCYAGYVSSAQGGKEVEIPRISA